jgi:hypothetical protein
MNGFSKISRKHLLIYAYFLDDDVIPLAAIHAPLAVYPVMQIAIMSARSCPAWRHLYTERHQCKTPRENSREADRKTVRGFDV